jgi:L-alanine-DL-glutamate epimerase-like enolase superfamily enzyme
MLRNVTSRVERWPLASPFRISRGVRTVAEVVTVELRQGAASGIGEAVPYARYGETPDSVLAQIRSLHAALERGATRADIARLLPAGAARNAVDCALWDLEAALAGTDVADMLGAPPLRPITTALTISLDTPERMREAAASLGNADLVKVKVNADNPEAALRAVRAAVPSARLIVDPNESWTLPILERLQPLLAELQVTFVEQPLPAGDDACLQGFEARVPICADESCHTAADLDGLVGRYGIVNIKLDKTGGLTEALGLLDQARSRGFGVMVGCMISTSLSIAPAFHVAARADFADLDGPLWIKDDRPGGVRLEGGRLLPPGAGFWGSAADELAS